MPERFFGEMHESSQPPETIEISERRKVQSDLEGPKGEHAELSIAIAEDGCAKRINFWDLDKTLLRAEPIHAAAVVEIFPKAEDVEELRKVYFAGFKLGNSFREWDRMHRIYTEGQERYKDPRVYADEIVAVEEERIKVDQAGHPAHERANETLQRYGQIAYDLMARKRKQDEEEGKDSFFESKEFKLEAPFHLLEAKSRMGEIHVFMTANQKDFAKALVAFSGLYKHGMFLATDETMVGGGKEIAIAKLIEQIEAKGIGVPKNDKNRLVVYGDSAKGDIGSGNKVTKTNPEYQFSGGLVMEEPEELTSWHEQVTQEAAKDEKPLTEIFSNIPTTPIINKEAKRSARGIFKLGKRRNSAEE